MQARSLSRRRLPDRELPRSFRVSVDVERAVLALALIAPIGAMWRAIPV